MIFNWSDLFAAFALYLVLEGIMPFMNPAAMRKTLAKIVSLSDTQLRIAGLISMLIGVAILFSVRAS